MTERTKVYTLAEIRDIVPEVHRPTVNRWLTRGDGIAVYENHDLSSSACGQKQFVSFGSEAAQLETGAPPDRLPDIGQRINWRYLLQGVYQGEVL